MTGRKRPSSWARAQIRLARAAVRRGLARETILDEAAAIVAECRLADYHHINGVTKPSQATLLDLYRRSFFIRWGGPDEDGGLPLCARVTGVQLLDWLDEQRAEI